MEKEQEGVVVGGREWCLQGREVGSRKVDGRCWLFRAAAQSAGGALVEMKLQA